MTIKTMTRMSVDSGGFEANFDSFNATITPDGRYVVFDTSVTAVGLGAPALTVYRYDTQNGTLAQVTTGPDGYCSHASISADGRYVVYESQFPAGLGLTSPLVFMKDMDTGAVTLVSSDSNGVQANGTPIDGAFGNIALNGRYVVFESGARNLVAHDTNVALDVFVKDVQTGVTSRGSVAADGTQANGGDSLNPQITPDGRYVVFEVAADNLVGGDTNSHTDIFRKDAVTGDIVRASIDQNGAEANDESVSASISDEGRYVAFAGRATNLVAGGTN